MSNGANQAITYEEVKAYQANQGIAMYAGGSGGYTTGGIWINWDQTTGFTGGGWQSDNSLSPAYNWTQEEIDQEISANGNLNAMFSAWNNAVDYEARYGWIFSNVPGSCRFEVTTG